MATTQPGSPSAAAVKERTNRSAENLSFEKETVTSACSPPAAGREGQTPVRQCPWAGSVSPPSSLQGLSKAAQGAQGNIQGRVVTAQPSWKISPCAGAAENPDTPPMGNAGDRGVGQALPQGSVLPSPSGWGLPPKLACPCIHPGEHSRGRRCRSPSQAGNYHVPGSAVMSPGARLPSKQFTGRSSSKSRVPGKGPVMDAQDTGAKLPPPGGRGTADEEKALGVRGRKRQRQERSGERDRWW